MTEEKYVLKYKDFKKGNPTLDHYKLVGDKVEKLEDEDDMNAVFSKDNLFRTEIKVFGLYARISTTFFPITVDSNQELFFESMVFSEIEELNCKYSKRDKSLKEALFSHYDLTSLAYGYLKGQAHTNNILNKLDEKQVNEKIDIKKDKEHIHE